MIRRKLVTETLDLTQNTEGENVGGVEEEVCFVVELATGQEKAGEPSVGDRT